MNGTQNRRNAKGERQVMNKTASKKSVPTWLRPGMHSGVQSAVKMPKPKNFGHNSEGDVKGPHHQDLCAIANPGNLISCNVGGGSMGHAAAHDNEAPFPLELAAFFVKSFAPPGGIVADCFAGSGTTIDAAVQHGRRGIGCDIRASQIELIERRMATVTPALFA